jgi:putative spermidine/putrescine transport system ATP-binding protein
MQQRLGITFIHVTHTQLEAVAVADQVVVMAQGRVVQSSSARGIYTEPLSAYVARFMGGQNVLSGAVAAVAGGVATLQGGYAVRVTGRPPMVGQDVAFAVRRDRINLVPAGQPGTPSVNSVSGIIRAVEYQGIFVKATLLQDHGAGEFVIYVDEGEYFQAPVGIGARATGWWDIDEAHLLRAE